MIRGLFDRFRRNPVIVGVAAIAVVLAATLVLRGTGADQGTPSAIAADPVHMPTPLDDTGIQRWAIEAPEPLPEPRAPRAPDPVPTPNVDWNALAVGVSDVSVGQDIGLSVHADVDGALSSTQRQALISQAEAEAAGAGAGRLPGFVGAVVARGTPGGGACSPTNW